MFRVCSRVCRNVNEDIEKDWTVLQVYMRGEGKDGELDELDGRTEKGQTEKLRNERPLCDQAISGRQNATVRAIRTGYDGHSRRTRHCSLPGTGAPPPNRPSGGAVRHGKHDLPERR